jgi:hypothetical protein
LKSASTCAWVDLNLPTALYAGGPILPHHDAACGVSAEEFLPCLWLPGSDSQNNASGKAETPVVVPSGHELQPYIRVAEICYAKCKGTIEIDIQAAAGGNRRVGAFIEMGPVALAGLAKE